MPTLPGIPEQIARYQLLSELGRGSMGHVYLALDPNIDRKVAIKIFLPLLKVGVAEQWELRQRFVFEARAAGQLKHPGIVTIYDADTDPDTGLSYLAMEWVNGPSLDDLIRESGPVGVERSMTIVEEVAVALDAAHRLGLVHRDIKPANILLEASGRAKVTDFGIAKLASMSITTTGWIPGSPFYMSPEQIRNENIDRRSDLYALGAVLYQCLTGRLPFEAESLAALTHMILEIDPRPVRSVNPAVSSELAAVIDQAMAKSPDDRFDSGREFARGLQLARAGEFRPASRGTERAGRGRGTVEKPAGELAVRGTGTIGLAAPSRDEPPAAAEPPSAEEPRVAEPPSAEEPAQAPAGANDPPAQAHGRRAVVSSGVGRLAIALGIVLVLVALWSLSPVASEPTGQSPVVERILSLAPRFAADAPPAGPALEVPSQPPAAAESPAPVAAPREPPSRRVLRQSLVVEPAATATAVEPAPREPASLPPPAPVVRATSKLELVYRNRLKNASLAVFIDGKRAFSSSIATPPGFLNRTVGKNFWTSLPLTAGEHVVDVRVTGAEGKVDLVRRTTATFEDGQTHRLRVTMTPLKNLKLNWKESPVD
jgi:serine/threonine-protein kinase